MYNIITLPISQILTELDAKRLFLLSFHSLERVSCPYSSRECSLGAFSYWLRIRFIQKVTWKADTILILVVVIRFYAWFSSHNSA